jgi:hyperosmotically inducible periplasmic protein
MTMQQIFVPILIVTAAFAQQPDNTGKNKRDRDGSTMTAEKQGSSKADLDLVAAIRRSITQDKTLSTNAHNVKVIVNGGFVWLRGPIPNEAEKDRVIAIAKKFAGDENVTSFLEVMKGEK